MSGAATGTGVTAGAAPAAGAPAHVDASGRTVRRVPDVPGAAVPDWYPSSPVVTAGPFAFTASTSAADLLGGGLAPGAEPPPGLPYSGGHPVKLQVREVYRRLEAALAAAGSSLEGGVSINQWQPTYHGEVPRHPADRDPYPLFWEGWRRVAHAYIQGRDEFLLADRPASCLMPVDRLVHARTDVEVQLVSLLEGCGITKRAYAHDVHSPLGGYSVGVEAGPWVFSAGFIATDFSTGLHPNARVPQHIWYGNQVAQEVEEVLRQVRVTMEASGARWRDVVKVDLYLTPEGVRNLPAIDEVWRAQWPVDPPARAVVPVTGIGGVKGGNVEISVVVARTGDGGDRQVVATGAAPDALGHAVQAVRSGPLLFLSTRLGHDGTGPSARSVALREGLPHARRHVVDQVRRIHEDVAAVCEAAGTSIDRAVRANLFLGDLVDLPAVLGAWGDPFTDGPPACGFFEVPPGSHEVPGCDLAVDLVVAM